MALLLVIRHAIAEERSDFARRGKPDDARPLTAVGRSKMRQVSAALHGLLPRLDLLATSPLVRAHQTAQIVAAEYGSPMPTVAEALRPGSSGEALLAYLKARRSARTVAIVGHEPTLSQQASFLLSGRERSFIQLKKGGACLLEFDAGWRAGAAKLLWLLPPGELRRLAR